MLMPGARYEKLIEAFGGQGLVLHRAGGDPARARRAAEWGGPSIVHIALDPKAGRKPQEFAWKS